MLFVWVGLFRSFVWVLSHSQLFPFAFSQKNILSKTGGKNEKGAHLITGEKMTQFAKIRTNISIDLSKRLLPFETFLRSWSLWQQSLERQLVARIWFPHLPTLLLMPEDADEIWEASTSGPGWFGHPRQRIWTHHSTQELGSVESVGRDYLGKCTMSWIVGVQELFQKIMVHIGKSNKRMCKAKILRIQRDLCHFSRLLRKSDAGKRWQSSIEIAPQNGLNVEYERRGPGHFEKVCSLVVA